MKMYSPKPKTDNRPYALKLKDPRWQKKKNRILERDNYTCQDTGKTDETLEVHHCYYAKGEPWDTPDEFLMTLCSSAHKKRQLLENEAKKSLATAFASMNENGYGDPNEGLKMIVQTLLFLAGKQEAPYDLCISTINSIEDIEDDRFREFCLVDSFGAILSSMEELNFPIQYKVDGCYTKLIGSRLAGLINSSEGLKKALFESLKEMEGHNV